MNPRIICPHCHSPVDPFQLEEGACGSAQYRICPECDEPVAFSSPEKAALPSESSALSALATQSIELPPPIFCIEHGAA